MTPTAGSGLEIMVMELDINSALYNQETMTYAINFELLKDTSYVFTIEATDKAEIEYSISAIDWAFDNYEGTEITVNGTDKLEGRYVAPRVKDKASTDSYLFHNIFANNLPPTPPGDEPPVVPDEPDVPEEPVEIDEPEVTLVDIPGKIIEEDIPLGDAPPTGDNANLVPFLMMTLTATALMITHKWFNE